MILGAGIHGWHRAFGSLLLMLVLLVSNAPFVNALLLVQADCGTACCRKKKSCCSRKKAADRKPTVSSISTKPCPPGCVQVFGIPSVPLTHAALSFAAAHHIPFAAAICLPILLLVLTCAPLCFALFQRPPPPHFLPAQ